MEATENGKYMIKASSILEITLEDYHKSRQQYGSEFRRGNEKINDFSNMNMNMNNFGGMENNNNYNINIDANDIMEVKIKYNKIK